MFMLAAAASLTLSSCSDDDDSNAGGVAPNSYLTVDINGVEKSFSDVQGRWVDGGNFLEINATNNGTEWVSFTVMSETSRVPEGSYSLDDASPYTILSVYTADGGTQMNYTATRNTLAPEDAFNLDIDDISNTSVEGTFSGVLVMVQGENTLGSVSLANGEFKTGIAPN